jgi:hypothetical protein
MEAGLTRRVEYERANQEGEEIVEGTPLYIALNARNDYYLLREKITQEEATDILSSGLSFKGETQECKRYRLHYPSGEIAEFTTTQTISDKEQIAIIALDTV